MKLAFVVQRYGIEVNGGAEMLCRHIAEHLIKYFDIDIITTCAIDYITWKNEYPEGISMVENVWVYRFQVDYPRDIQIFGQFNEKIFNHPHSEDDEIQWMKLQGPYSSKLLEYIKDNEDEYDFFIFFTYLYCTTFFGLPLVSKKAILVPTAHDEPPIYLSIFDTLFSLPKGLIFSTKEEEQFVFSKFCNQTIVHAIIGTGIDIPETIDPIGFKNKFGIDNFIIYVGRIDTFKACDELFQNFIRFKKEREIDIKLVLLGKPVMEIPHHSDIIHLGFLSDQDKFDAIAGAKVLVMPSKYESLSMVLLEAWLCSVPVLVNGMCDVLKGQCIRANGGLWYTNFDEFADCLTLLLFNDELNHRLGLNGKQYVNNTYSWNVIETKYLNFISSL